MEFTTKVDIGKSRALISHEQKILLLGSCFSDNIGEKLVDAGFDATVNPLGTLYNPASIKEAICPSDWDEFVKWLHSRVNGQQSTVNSQRSTSGEEELKNSKPQKLKTSDYDTLIITFGTAWVFRLKETGMIVANCRKQPDCLFRRERLSVDDIVDMWVSLLEKELSGTKVIFTVSPIRHKKDGFHGNQLSKSTLLLAIDRLIEKFPEKCEYFPAYEILMDELRDYRFYADDMLHPSQVAVNYIWQLFQDKYFSESTKQKVLEEEKKRKAERHVANIVRS